jgi:hypothetical protein
MKGSYSKIRLVSIAIVLPMVIIGCVSFDKRLMDPDVSINDHAVLYFDSAINDPNIDGDEVKGGYHSPLIEYDAMVMLSPGLHTVTARYAKRVESGGYYHDTSTGYITIEYDFQAGGRYYMDGKVQGNQMVFGIKKVQSLNKEDRKLKSLKYPKKIAPAVVNQKLLKEAAEAVPTKFEGEWKGYGTDSKPTGFIYIFRGNAYYYINPGNILSNMAGTGSDPSEVGTFEYTDSAMALTPLKKRKVGFLSLKSVLKNVKPVKREFTYALNQDTFVLSYKNKQMGTFIKQSTQ